MSSQLKPEPVSNQVEGQVDTVIAELGGDARAAIRALLHNRDELLRDADRPASLGFLCGRFSEGARPARERE